MSFAVDANVLLYASDRGSAKNGEALRFLNRCAEGPEPFCIPWPVLMAYLRISTHPGIFRRPLAPVAAARNVDELLALPHVRPLGETDGFWEAYREVTGTQAFRGNMVPDAHVAAILKIHDVRTLYTSDRDFRRFDFLDVRDPFA